MKERSISFSIKASIQYKERKTDKISETRNSIKESIRSLQLKNFNKKLTIKGKFLKTNMLNFENAFGERKNI